MADKARVAILVSGRGSNMAALVYAAKLPGCPYEVTLVTGDNPQAPALAIAEAEGVPVLRLAAPATGGKTQWFAQLDEALRSHRADYVALAGFMRIIPPGFVAAWNGRLVNIHPSLLPAWPGLDTHAAVLRAGETVTGCTVHLVTERVDDGPILGQIQVAVLPGDTPETLAARVLVAEHQLYPRALAAFVECEPRRV